MEEALSEAEGVLVLLTVIDGEMEEERVADAQREDEGVPELLTEMVEEMDDELDSDLEALDDLV